MTFLGAALMLVGSVFALLSAVGLWRFPDLYTRLHAAALAGPLGSGVILLSVAITAGDLFATVRCALGFVFLIIATPISAHLLARAVRRTASSPTNIASIKNIGNSR